MLADGRRRHLHRPGQREGRRAHDARHPQPALRAGRHGRVPARAEHRHHACAAPYNSLGGNGYDGYDTATRGYVTDTINGTYKTGGVLDPASGLYLHTVDGPANSCIQAGGNTSYSEALRQAQTELDTQRAAERARLHRLPDRRRGQHRQRLRCRRSDLPAEQRRRPAALPHRGQRRQRLQGGGHDDLQHRLRAGQQRRLHRGRLPHEERAGQLGRVHRSRPPAATTTPATRSRARRITSFATLSQIASPGTSTTSRRRPAQHDLRRHRDRHRLRAPAGSSTTASKRPQCQGVRADIAERSSQAPGDTSRYSPV